VEASQVLSAAPVDVVLLDLAHATDGAEGFMTNARRSGYAGQFLVVAEGADARTTALAIMLGAAGIFLKSEAPSRLVEAIRLVANGAAWLDQKIIRLLADQSVARLPQRDDGRTAKGLTDREQRVLLGILGGLTNKKIGEGLGLSEGTVKSSVQQLFLRAGVRTRSQLVRAALEGSLGVARELAERSRTSLPAPSISTRPHASISGNKAAPAQTNG
jgi:DNA-binding NarL/FixJ family response regulator